MADDGRNPPADLNSRVSEVGFFQMLRSLEHGGQRFGRSGGPSKEPARLGQPIRLSFAVGDVASVVADTSGKVRVAVNAIGLFGPEGPMPLFMTRWMLERASNRWFAGQGEGATSDSAFLDFANMLQHRAIAFYWRAWADMNPAVQICHGNGGNVAALIRALSGTGLPGTRGGGAERNAIKLEHATSLAHYAQSPDRLVAYVQSVAGAPMTLDEFVGVWVDIPRDLQTRLGRRHSRIGQDAVVGGRVFDRQNRAAITIGPLPLKRYLEFISNGDLLAELRHALTFAMGRDIIFDLRLSIEPSEVPEPRLGSARLGQTVWLGRPKSTSEYRMRAFTELAQEMAA